MDSRGPEAGDVIANKYRLVRPLGDSTTGLVFEAEQLILQRRVAIKLVPVEGAPPHLPKEFLGRARAASQLDHPGFARLMDSGKTQDGLLYAVSELILVGDLEHTLRGHGRLPETLATAVMTQLLDAVAAMHTRGLVHGDLHPKDILVVDPGDLNHPPQIKLGDLGLARISGTGPQDLHPFSAPEYVQGRPITEQTDVYTCGAILGWLLSGQPPAVPDPTHPDQGRAAWNLENVHLAEIVARATALAPSERYASAKSMKKDLQAVLDGAPTSTSFSDRPALALPTPKALPFAPEPRRGWIWLVFVLLLAAGGGAGWYLYTHDPRRQLSEMLAKDAHGAAETYALEHFDDLKDRNDATHLVLQAMAKRRLQDLKQSPKLKFDPTYVLLPSKITGKVRYEGKQDQIDPFEMTIDRIDGHRLQGTFLITAGAVRASIVGYWDGNHILFWDDQIEWAESAEYRKNYQLKEKTNAYILGKTLTSRAGVYGSWIEGSVRPLKSQAP